MAAGTYDITTGLSTLLVRREDNGSATFAIAFWGYAGKTQEQAKLVFKTLWGSLFPVSSLVSGHESGA